jgi:Flp pilus assembly protein TadD
MTISPSSPISAIILPRVLPPAPYFHDIVITANKGAIGKAYYLAERYDETIDFIDKWIHHYPPQWSFHQLLAIAYALLGREDDKMEFAEVLKIDPNISVKQNKKRLV